MTSGNPAAPAITGGFSRAADEPWTDEAVNVLVLGIGNLLLADEGAGVRVVEELLARYRLPPGVEAVDGGTMGLELLSYLDGRSHVLIVDAVASGKKPGSVVRIPLDDPPAFFRTRISPHQIGLAELLAVSALTGNLPPEVVLFGIEPGEIATGLALSPEVGRKIGPVADMIASELNGLGLRVTRFREESGVDASG